MRIQEYLVHSIKNNPELLKIYGVEASSGNYEENSVNPNPVKDPPVKRKTPSSPLKLLINDKLFHFLSLRKS